MNEPVQRSAMTSSSQSGRTIETRSIRAAGASRRGTFGTRNKTGFAGASKLTVQVYQSRTSQTKCTTVPGKLAVETEQAAKIITAAQKRG